MSTTTTAVDLTSRGTPVAGTVVSLPPRVLGPIRHHLRINVSKIVWTGPTRLAHAPFVRWRWWGQTEVELATSLYPPVGVGKMSVNPKGGTATGIGAGTAAGVSGTGDGAHAGAASAVDPAQRGVRFPVRCSRRQLNGYFKDMNIAVVPSSPPPPRHTVIQVLESTTNRPVGCVFLHDLVRLTEDEAASSPSNTVPLSNKGMPGKKKLPSKGSPSKVPPSKAPAPATTATPSKASNGPRMINGFYPILAPPQSTTSRAPPIGKQQKTSVFPTSRTTAIPQDWVNVGKAHFIITLEPVTSTERRQQMQEGSTAVPYFFDRHTNADASFQSTRYNGAGQAVASSFDEPSTLSQATAPIEPPLPPAEMTMMSLPGSPIKQVPAPARKPSPVKRVLFQSRSPSPVSRKENISENVRDATVEASRSGISKEKLARVYEHARQLKNKMKRSLREDVTADHDPSMMHFDAESLEDISINEDEDDEDHLFSNVNASNISLDAVSGDDKLVLESLNSNAAARIISRELEKDAHSDDMDDELMSLDSDMIGDDRVIVLDDAGLPLAADIDMDNSSRRSPSKINADKLAPLLLLQLGRVDAIRVDVLEVSLSKSNAPLRAELLLPNDDGELLSIELDAATRIGSVIVPMRFDDAAVRRWTDEHVIVRLFNEEVNVIAGVSCMQTVDARDFTWEGRLPMWRVGVESTGLQNRAMFRQVLADATAEIVGNIKLRVQLSTSHRDIPLDKASYPEDEFAMTQHVAEEVRHEPVASKSTITSPKRPVGCYIFASVGAARIRALPDPSNHAITLHLTTKFASLIGSAIETRPVTPSPTGTVDFRFQYTAPFTFGGGKDGKTAEFIIVEVWSTETPKRMSLETTESSDAFTKRQIVGLVKLPLAFLARGIEQHMADSSEAAPPLVVPAADYPIVDVLGGVHRGWVTCSLAAGTLAQINHVMEKPGTADSEQDQHQQSVRVIDDKTSHSAQVSPKRISSTPMPIFPIQPSAPPLPASHIEVTVHRACGLDTAIAKLMPLGRREFAVELTIFPGEVDAEAKVVSPFVRGTSAPAFEYSHVVAVPAITTRMIMWILNGGCARGTVLYRTGKEVVRAGSFDLPLKPLLSSAAGIRRQWATVIADEVGNKVGAVESSVRVLDGFDLGLVHKEEEPEMTMVSNMDDAICSLAMTLELPGNLRPLRWRLNRRRTIAQTSIYGDWHSFKNTATKAIFELALSPQLAPMLQYGQLELQVESDGVYVGSAFIETETMGGHLARWLRSSSKHTMAQEVVVEGTYDLIDPTAEVFTERMVVVALRFAVGKLDDKSTRTDAPAKVQQTSSSVVSAGQRAVSPSEIPVHVTVERAMHLNQVMAGTSASTVTTDNHQLIAPNTFVSFVWPSSDGQQREYKSPVVPCNVGPTWDFRVCVSQSTTVAALQRLKSSPIIFSVWHSPASTSATSTSASVSGKPQNRLLGYARVDLAPLYHGFSAVRGWYRILNHQDRPVGELKIEVQPFETLSPPRLLPGTHAFHESIDARQKRTAADTANSAFSASVHAAAPSKNGLSGASPQKSDDARTRALTDYSTDVDEADDEMLRDRLRKSIIGLEEVHVKLAERLRMRSPTRKRPLAVRRRESDGQFFAESAQQDEARATMFFGGPRAESVAARVEAEDCALEDDDSLTASLGSGNGDHELTLEDLGVAAEGDMIAVHNEAARRALSSEDVHGSMASVEVRTSGKTVDMAKDGDEPCPEEASSETITLDEQDVASSVATTEIPNTAPLRPLELGAGYAATIEGSRASSPLRREDLPDQDELSREADSDDETTTQLLHFAGEEARDVQPEQVRPLPAVEDVSTASSRTSVVSAASVVGPASVVESTVAPVPTPPQASTTIQTLADLGRSVSSSTASESSLRSSRHRLPPMSTTGNDAHATSTTLTPARSLSTTNLPSSLSKEELDRITRIFNSRPAVPPISRSASQQHVVEEGNGDE